MALSIVEMAVVEFEFAVLPPPSSTDILAGTGTSANVSVMYVSVALAPVDEKSSAVSIAALKASRVNFESTGFSLA